MARCRCIAEIGARDIAGETFAAIARASQVRDVLVEQSAGLASEALGEVRQQAERADDLIDAAARSMLPRRWREKLARSRASQELQAAARTGASEGEVDRGG